jgi:hypothetical protein
MLRASVGGGPVSRRTILMIPAPLFAIGAPIVVHVFVVQPLIEAAYHGGTIPSVDSFVAARIEVTSYQRIALG